MNLKYAVVAVAALGGVALSSATASAAMPNGLPSAATTANQSANVDQVRYVCNAWGRCWWRPNYYGPRYYGYGPRLGPRFYGPRPWGYRHGWRRW